MHRTHDSQILDQLTHNKNPKLILAGNPNVGKSVFFNALTGSYVDVSNFPGTTVDITLGRFDHFTVIDTPGVYGISSFNDEEKVTRDSIIYADLVLNVVDAVHLERDLFLTQQLIDMGKPMVVALNMYDELKAANIHIDVQRLSEELGVDVIPCAAIRNIGIDDVKRALKKGGRIGNRSPEVDSMIQSVVGLVDSDAEAVLLLEEDENILADHAIKQKYACRECMYILRRKHVTDLMEKVYAANIPRRTFGQRLGDLLMRPATGFPILALLLASIFAIIGVVVAQGVVGFTEGILMDQYYRNFIQWAVGSLIDPAGHAGALLIGDYGLLTMVPIYLFGLLLPLVIAFYFMMSILEDSGLLPRIAVLLDRLFNVFGLNGRAVIPMILGFGCVTMALISTRILGSKRERLIATILLCVAVPCSAQFGVIVAIAASLDPWYSIVYAASILSVFVILGLALNRLLPGFSTDLLIDIPPVRKPEARNLLKKTAAKAKHFLFEAGPMFALGAIIVTILDRTGSIPAINRAFAPIAEHVLQLPAEIANVFIMGIIRRDFGAAGLSTMVDQGLLSPAQTVVALVVITLFVPCIASIMVLFKERRPIDAALIWIGSFLIAFIAGWAVSAILI